MTAEADLHTVREVSIAGHYAFSKVSSVKISLKKQFRYPITFSKVVSITGVNLFGIACTPRIQADPSLPNRGRFFDRMIPRSATVKCG